MIFLSYASDDFERASKVYDHLERDGFHVWMDKKSIKPGQEWEPVIWQAAMDADIFCLLLSEASITKRGFVRKEIRFALEKWKETLPEDSYLIPCRIDRVEPPFELRHLQYIDLIDDKDYDTLSGVLRQCPAANYEVRRLKSNENGIDIDIEYPHFGGQKFSSLNAEIVDFIKKVEAEKNEFDDGSFIACEFSVSFATSKLVSVFFLVDWYSVGAVHPKQFFKTFNFDCDRGESFELIDVFANSEKGIAVVSAACKFDLSKQYSLYTSDSERIDEINDWIGNGAGPTWNNFRNFVFKNHALEILFTEYQTGSYAEGPRTVSIGLSSLRGHLNDRFAKLLGDKSWKA